MPFKAVAPIVMKKKGQALFREVSHPSESIQGLPIKPLMKILNRLVFLQTNQTKHAIKHLYQHVLLVSLSSTFLGSTHVFVHPHGT